jgi:hypothetical protein
VVVDWECVQTSKGQVVVMQLFMAEVAGAGETEGIIEWFLLAVL